MSMTNDTIGNRTHDLPTCSAVPQPSAPQCAPVNILNMHISVPGGIKKGKAVPLQAWTGPEGSRKLRFPDFVTMAQDGGRLSALRTGRLYPAGNTPGTHFCYRLGRPQSHSAIGSILCQ